MPQWKYTDGFGAAVLAHRHDKAVSLARPLVHVDCAGDTPRVQLNPFAAVKVGAGNLATLRWRYDSQDENQTQVPVDGGLLPLLPSTVHVDELKRAESLQVTLEVQDRKGKPATLHLAFDAGSAEAALRQLGCVR